MVEQNDRARRRPVDALFGEATSSSPSYVVEPPQPDTTVSPPSPDEITASLTVDAEPAVEPMTEQTPELPAVFTEPESQTEQAVSETNATTPAPTPAPAPLFSDLPPLSADDSRFLTMSDRIERLYGEVKLDLGDSQVATEYCFGLLMQAREACEQRDYARSEYFVQLVDAKLKRSSRSNKSSHGIAIVLLWVWELIALVLGGAMIAMTYVPSLTLFGLPVASELIILLRALGWGMIGGVIGAMNNLPKFVQFREYDPASNMEYFAHPFKGGLLGALFFLISQAGILAGNVILPGGTVVGPLFLYVFAALAGFKQEYVIEFFDTLLKTIFRGAQGAAAPKTKTVTRK